MKISELDKKFLQWLNKGSKITILTQMVNENYINSFLRLNDYKLIDDIEYDEDYNVGQGRTAMLKRIIFSATLTMKGKWMFFKSTIRQRKKN